MHSTSGRTRRLSHFSLSHTHTLSCEQGLVRLNSTTTTTLLLLEFPPFAVSRVDSRTSYIILARVVVVVVVVAPPLPKQSKQSKLPVESSEPSVSPVQPPKTPQQPLPAQEAAKPPEALPFVSTGASLQVCKSPQNRYDCPRQQQQQRRGGRSASSGTSGGRRRTRVPTNVTIPVVLVCRGTADQIVGLYCGGIVRVDAFESLPRPATHTPPGPMVRIDVGRIVDRCCPTAVRLVATMGTGNGIPTLWQIAGRGTDRGVRSAHLLVRSHARRRGEEAHPPWTLSLVGCHIWILSLVHTSLASTLCQCVRSIALFGKILVLCVVDGGIDTRKW